MRTIGIIGGMGPEAANRLSDLIAGLTQVSCDQDHLPVLVYNNPRIPSRVDALLLGSKSPVKELIKTAEVLQKGGADFLLMPCNVAHAFLPELQAAVNLPILNMVTLTVQHCLTSYPQARTFALLASPGTLACRLYQDPLQLAKRNVLLPNELEQRQVTDAIYGLSGIKCGYREGPTAVLGDISRRLEQRGADAVIAACTEISLLLAAMPPAIPFVDPLEVAARSAIELCGGRVKARALPVQQTAGVCL